MRTLIVATAIVLAGASGAVAACPSYPDTAETGFVENRTAHALCLQRELAEATRLAAERARLDAAIGNIEIELGRQRMLAEQRAAALEDRF